MVCPPCRKGTHKKCPARKIKQPTHCDCQHRTGQWVVTDVVKPRPLRHDDAKPV